MDPHLKKLQQEIAAAVDGLSAEQLKQHPPGKWCVGEVLEHLYLTYTGTLKGFESVAEAGRPLATTQTWTQRGRTLIVVALGYLPPAEKPRRLRVRGDCRRRRCWRRLAQRSPKWITGSLSASRS